MCPKIRCDGECEKFCKIFCKLNWTQIKVLNQLKPHSVLLYSIVQHIGSNKEKQIISN